MLARSLVSFFPQVHTGPVTLGLEIISDEVIYPLPRGQTNNTVTPALMS